MATTAEFNQVVRRLAQYRPFEQEGRDVHAAVRDLLLTASAVEGGGFPSLSAAQKGIQALWGIDVELDEVRQVVDALKKNGHATSVKGGFTLAAEVLERLERTARENEDTERQAFADWEQTVREQRPDLTDDDFEVLSEDLRTWLGQVIARHGVESALILYPENPRAQEVFDSIESAGLAFLPKRSGCVGAIREWALQAFVREPTEAQRRYLVDLLNTAFYMTVLTLDSEASQLVQDRVAGHRVYLDTNFLYSLLGLGTTAAKALSAARLIELTKELGYELAVTDWTVEELRSSIRAAENRINRGPMPRQELAELMLLRSGESDVTKAYWVKYRESAVRPKDFFDLYRHVETVLEDHGVSVVNESCEVIDRPQSRAAVEQQLVLLDRFLDHDRNDRIKEHDVKHRLLIERLRGHGNVTFSNARYWFLTQDSKLPRYAMAVIDGAEVQLPFCVSTSAWMQVMRAFTPRTDDFDQSLVELLATPYLRRRRGPGVQPGVVDAVVGRVDVYKGATSKLAAEVLADTALVESIAAARDEAEEIQQVENAFIAKAEELRDRAEESERRVVTERSQRKTAEEAKRAAQETSKETAARLEELERQVAEQHEADEARRERDREEEERRRRQQEADEAEARERREAEEAELEERARSDRARAELAERRLVVAAAVALLIVAAAITVVSLMVVELSPGLLVTALSAAALAVCGAVRLGLGEKHGTRALSFLFGFSGIVGLILAVVLD